MKVLTSFKPKSIIERLDDHLAEASAQLGYREEIDCIVLDQAEMEALRTSYSPLLVIDNSCQRTVRTVDGVETATGVYYKGIPVVQQPIRFVAHR